MTEPNTTASVVTGAAVAIGVSNVMGVTYDVMFWSVLGALAGMRFAPAESVWWKALGSVASAAVIAAIVSPIASVWAVSALPALGTSFKGQTLNPWIAGITAAFGPMLFPKLIDALGLFWARLAGTSGAPKP